MLASFLRRCLLVVAVAQPLPAAADLLWYDQPAQGWMTQALPLGNGRVGAMFFGGIDQERIQFNEESLWTGKPAMLAPDNNPARWNEVHNLLRQGDFAAANKLGLALRATLYGTPAYGQYQQAFGANQAFGDLLLEMKHPAGTATAYRRQLDIATAVGEVRYTVGGVNFRREYFASFPGQVMVVRLTADQPGRISLKAGFATPHRAAAVGVKDSRLGLAGKLAGNGMAFEARLAARIKGGTLNASAQALEITGADEAELLLDAATDYRNPAYAMHTGDPPEAACERHLDAAMRQSYTDLRAAHVADYQALHRRVALDLGGAERAAVPTDRRLAEFRKQPDPPLEALIFQYGRYLLISSSRPGTMPANLQGLWNDSTNPPWTCDWHFDINVQMNYWPAEVTGLPECHEPLFHLLRTLQEPGAEVANRAFNARGWFAPINSNPWGYSDNRWHSRGLAGWLCQHLWEHYQYSGDREFLANTAFPMMKNAALFLLDSLIEVDGELVTGAAESPENKFKAPDGQLYWLDFGVAMDMQVAWELFGNCAEAAALLGIDEALAQQLTVARAGLAPPRIGRFGQLQEWYHDFDRTDDKHRHTSHLWAVFPGRQITPREAPDLAKAAAVSLKHRGLAANGWAFPWRSLVYSRLGDSALAYHWLKGGMAHTTTTAMVYDRGGGMYPNMLGASPPFQIDSNFGTTAAIAEMLLQSHRRTADGSPVLDLLPALPAAWPNGKTTGLRARGGFSVDLAWQDSKLTGAVIRSNSGTSCEVRHGTTVTRLNLKPGEHQKLP
jgi:alpha-L-fucosidase 2